MNKSILSRIKNYFSNTRTNASSAVAPELSNDMILRLAKLQPFLSPTNQTIEQQPLVVFDLETSGLDTKRDVVLSAGAVRIEQQAIVLAKPFEIVLKVETELPPDSQLFHGLTKEDLLHGQDPQLALLALLEYGQDAIWLAWHSAFDHAMLQRAAAHWLKLDANAIPAPLDLAHIAPIIFPEYDQAQIGLDYWMKCFELQMHARHAAAADALITAQLAQIILNKAIQKGYKTWGELADAITQRRRQLQHNELTFGG